MTDLPTIAHLLPAHNPFPPKSPAGTELRVDQAGRRHRRYRPLVVCGAFGADAHEEQFGPMTVRRIRFGKVYRRLFQKITRLDPLPYAKRMWRIVREGGAVLLHIHNEPKVLEGLAPYLRRQPLPVVVHIANDKPIPRHAIDLVTRWVACSAFMADWLHQDYGVPRDKIEVIYTGVDIAGRLPHWQQPAGRIAELRRRFGVAEDAFVFTFGGRLVKEKGVAEMLDAFALVRQRAGRPVHLLVAGNVREGKGPDNDKAIYGRAMAERMGSAEDVTWVGSLKPADMHDFLLAGDVFLLPSLWDDPFPTVMLEAAAAGLPIVAGARGGITEFLRACPGNRFVDPADPQQLAQAMLAWMDSAELRAEAGQWLRGRVERDFDWSRVAADFENLYDRLLGRHGAA